MSIFNKKQVLVTQMFENRSEFGLCLKKARKNKNLTQGEAAELLNKGGYTVIVNWEKGTSCPHLKDFVSVCNLYDITPNELLGFLK